MNYLSPGIRVIVLTTILILIKDPVVAQHMVMEDSTSAIRLSDPRIETLRERFDRTHELQGYRIQIITSSHREAAKKAKSKFLSLYQEFSTYESYQQPFYIIKVGDFLTKLEAERVHRMIKMEFQESYIVPDVITPFEQYSGK